MNFCLRVLGVIQFLLGKMQAALAVIQNSAYNMYGTNAYIFLLPPETARKTQYDRDSVTAAFLHTNTLEKTNLAGGGIVR